MKITNVRIHQFEGEGKVKAFGTVVFDGVLTVTDLKVVDGSKGLFVSMPSRKNKDGLYKDIVYPCTAEMRQAIQDAVLGAYRALVGTEAEKVARPDPDAGLEAEAGLGMAPGLDGELGQGMESEIGRVPEMEAESELDADPELAAVGSAIL